MELPSCRRITHCAARSRGNCCSFKGILQHASSFNKSPRDQVCRLPAVVLERNVRSQQQSEVSCTHRIYQKCTAQRRARLTLSNSSGKMLLCGDHSFTTQLYKRVCKNTYNQNCTGKVASSLASQSPCLTI